LIIREEFYNVTPAGGGIEMSAKGHGGHRQSLEISSELRGHRRHNVNGRGIRWCSGTPLLADNGSRHGKNAILTMASHGCHNPGHNSYRRNRSSYLLQIGLRFLLRYRATNAAHPKEE
jgi:hypothetical protein